MLTDEQFSALQKAYSNGFKMYVAICPRCGWDRGFFFFKSGRIGFDPGCLCNGNTAVKFSSRAVMEKYLAYHPEAYQRWMEAAEKWNARLAEIEVERKEYKQYLQDLQKKIEEKKIKPKLLF